VIGECHHTHSGGDHVCTVYKHNRTHCELQGNIHSTPNMPNQHVVFTSQAKRHY
jgi:hypothetical protein